MKRGVFLDHLKGCKELQAKEPKSNESKAKDSQVKDSKKEDDRFVIHIDDEISFKHFYSLLEFIYSGSTKIESRSENDSANPLIHLADIFELEPLKTMCQNAAQAQDFLVISIEINFVFLTIFFLLTQTSESFDHHLLP